MYANRDDEAAPVTLADAPRGRAASAEPDAQLAQILAGLLPAHSCDDVIPERLLRRNLIAPAHGRRVFYA